MRKTSLLLLFNLAEAMITSDVSRSRLFEAFSSPSGKLTFSPEIVIPEPKDPTAILLQTNAVQNLSSKIRACKANAAFIRSSVASVSTFVAEQEGSRGNFPGPVPLVFCPSDDEVEISDVAKSGVEGILLSVSGCDEITNVDEIGNNDDFAQKCKEAIKCGLQPIPEVTISEETASSWKEEDIEALVQKLSASIGNDPVSVVLTVNAVSDDSEDPVALPAIPKAIGKTVPIMGSVRVKAGEGRLGAETSRFKKGGFTGTVLRSECLPGLQVQLDLEVVALFWNNAINDLKSTKSKNFSFRSKNNMEKSQATVWGNYQKDILDSGALGDPDEMVSIDSANGDYQGFA